MEETKNSDQSVFIKFQKEHRQELGNQDRKWNDVFYKFCEENDKSKIEEEVQTETSWKMVPWDSIREGAAKLLLEKETKLVSSDMKGLILIQSLH